MIFFGYWTLFIALLISVVAAYYSIVGLAAIFASALVPVIIMGSALEVAKVTTAVWLHTFWDKAPGLIKIYLTAATVILMLITSMGIFGFLSKAHIEQTALAVESEAQILRIETEIARNTAIIERAEEKIIKAESTDTTKNADIQAQLDKEQERIDNAYTRVQPAIDEQNAIIQQQSNLYQSELDKIDQELATLQGYIDSGDIKKAQGMVGTKADGAYGPKTAAKFKDFQESKQQERSVWLEKLQAVSTSPVVITARQEITRLRTSADAVIANSNRLMAELQAGINVDTNEAVESVIEEQQNKIRLATSSIDSLTEEKYALEAETRKLEAEVGPVKYIAELIYSDRADSTLLEDAVRWVIIMLVAVFDPLAIVLVLAGVMTISSFNRKEKEFVSENTVKKIEEIEDESSSILPPDASDDIIIVEQEDAQSSPIVDEVEQPPAQVANKRTRKVKSKKKIDPPTETKQESPIAKPDNKVYNGLKFEDYNLRVKK